MKKVLITGANGFLGQHLTCFFIKAGYEVMATGKGPNRIKTCNVNYEEAELTDKEAVRQLLLKVSPEVIIHTAALSKPDECEANKEFCLKVNVEATNNLLQAASAYFIYISTDFIFGEDGPHGEDEEPHPLNFYGESKLKAEQLVKNSKLKYTIVRPVFIYGQAGEGMRPSFLHWVKNNLTRQKPIKVVSDQSRTPTYVEDICRGIETIIVKKATGVFNLAGKDILSPYEMALKTAEVLGLDKGLIEKVTAETFPEPVKRAKKSGLKIEQAQSELEYNPVSFEEGVRLTFER